MFLSPPVHAQLTLQTSSWNCTFKFSGLFQGGELDTTEGMGPLDVVVRILNNQLSSLMWIDEKVSKL